MRPAQPRTAAGPRERPPLPGPELFVSAALRFKEERCSPAAALPWVKGAGKARLQRDSGASLVGRKPGGAGSDQRREETAEGRPHS